MKNISIIFLSGIFILTFYKCKPAAENRVKMHQKANHISDSIAKSIDAALEEVKIEPKSPVANDTVRKAK